MSSVKADLSNWRDSPQNKWSFVNVDKILSTDKIKKSDSQPSSLPSSPRQFDDFNLKYNGQTLDLPSFLTESQSDGLIILQHGRVLYENYLNDNTPHTPHILMSLTKSVVGLLVGILQDQGKLHVDDLVSKYIPEVSDSFYKDVTIRQAIDMRSGAKYLDATPAYRVAAGWNPQGDEEHADLHSFIANFEPERAEDDRFEYVSVNTDMIGWVVERAGGKKIAELMSELLWQPMGAESDALMAVDVLLFEMWLGLGN
jgi:CubicO group peptidase (beta-lactamase class C family)